MTQPITQPQKGSLLVAEPFLGDPNFDRSVILLTEHNEQGSIGFVINKELEVSLEELVIDFPTLEVPVFHGGPVQEDNLFFVHNKGELIPGSQKINDQLSWGGDLEPLKEMIKMKLVTEDNIRFYLGYSGWSGGQLEAELDQNSWMVVNNAKINLFDNSREMWRKALLHAGGEYPLWANSPADPNLN